MDDSRVMWLKRELPAWVSEGLVAPEAADRIRRRYDEQTSGRGRSLALIAFGVLGAKMIGSGLILLIAHNWENLSQGVRAGMALSILAAAQALAGFALWRRADSQAWRESTAAFLTLAIGACMALITQTYNMLTSPEDFMLRWILLALPVVYITRSRVAAALYFVGVAWATAIGEGWGESGFILWALLAAIAPHLVSLVRDSGTDRGRSLVFWAAGLAVPLASGFVIYRVAEEIWMLFFAALFAAMFCLAERIENGVESLWRTPLAILGAVGVSAIGLILTFAQFWKQVDPPGWPDAGEPWLATAVTWVLMAGMILGASTICVRRFRQQRWAPAILCALPVCTAAGLALALRTGDGKLAALTANVYVFALGMAVLLVALAKDRLLLANAGMGLLSLLFFFRFVDADLTLVLRGVAFIVIGIAFLGMNVKLLWARREVRP